MPAADLLPHKIMSSALILIHIITYLQAPVSLSAVIQAGVALMHCCLQGDVRVMRVAVTGPTVLDVLKGGQRLFSNSGVLHLVLQLDTDQTELWKHAAVQSQSHSSSRYGGSSSGHVVKDHHQYMVALAKFLFRCVGAIHVPIRVFLSLIRLCSMSCRHWQ